MRTVEEAVQALGNLSATDRRWILEKLPAQARSRLAEQLRDPRDPSHSEMFTAPTVEPAPDALASGDYEWNRSVAQLSAANPTALAQVLQSEPAWLINALLHAAEWPWHQSVRKLLPASVRADVASLGHDGVYLSKPVIRVLVSELATRSLEWPPAPASSSKLRTLVSRFRAKVGR